MTEREKLLKQLSAAQFAAWETHIFLDTHPENQTALENMNRFREQANALTRQYESKYGPLTIADMYGDKRFEWLDSPWPWETEGGVN